MQTVPLRQVARPTQSTSGLLGVLASAVLLALLSVVLAPAASAGGYPAEVETRCSLNVSNGERVMRGSDVTLTVSSDAVQPQGTATFRLGSADEATVPVVGGEATYRIPATTQPGRYTLSAQYDPSGNGVKPCSASAQIIVTAGGPPGIDTGVGEPGDGGGTDGGGTGADGGAVGGPGGNGGGSASGPVGGDAGGSAGGGTGGPTGADSAAGVSSAGGSIPSSIAAGIKGAFGPDGVLGRTPLLLVLGGGLLLALGALLFVRRRSTADVTPA